MTINSIHLPFICIYRHVMHRINQFTVELIYFISVSFLGFLFLQSLNPRTENFFRPRNFDLFFTSVSATTVSSMSTVEMEVFSDTQLIVITFLMFIGGEVFTSMVGLHISSFKLKNTWKSHARIGSIDNIELGIVHVPNSSNRILAEDENRVQSTINNDNHHELKVNSIRFLGFLVLGYLLLFHFLGFFSVVIYINLVPSVKNVLSKKDLKQVIFTIFTVVSTFASCGFVPTNENMMAFKKNSTLLLILIPQVLFGNTLFPSCLRILIRFTGKFFKKVECQYLLLNTKEIGYFHLLPGRHSLFLAVTVLGFIAVQFVVFCALEWNSAALTGMNWIEKVVGILFQTTNARHTGESIVDLSSIAPAMVVLFVLMMYLPPYTSFLPIKGEEQNPQEFKTKSKGPLLDNLLFSQLTYLTIFIILICIIERENLKDDPLNFNVFNITVEVISAYGNVGFSTGYSCGRKMKADPSCVDKWYGFAGKWSDHSKFLLILVMFFGRLKKFNFDGGKAWKLL